MKTSPRLALRKIFHRHYHVPIVERHASRRYELERGALRTNFFDGEMAGALADRKPKGESHFAETGVSFLDPFLETVGIEGAHVADQKGMHQLTDCFPLLLGAGMHLEHTGFLSRTSAAAAASSPTVFSRPCLIGSTVAKSSATWRE